MSTIAVFFGLLAGAVGALIWVLLRRDNRPTENVDGLLIEQERRRTAAQDRISFNAVTQRSMPPGMRDSRHRR
ncbi:hypothetical protein V1460_34185 [Streptomyces sp. SCSIO 30461]|uniref:hypothetical protein n=1 Tax=Streptomyces sp. SCSIO 30461 TaxID=3118085 RepID=UPI0030CB16AC